MTRALKLLAPLALSLAACSSSTAGSGGPAIDSFMATPSTVASGAAVTLSWSVDGATSLAIDQGVGDVTGKTSVVVHPTQTVTYRLTATGATGTSSALADVTVSSAGGSKPVIASFSASPSTVMSGGAATLSWSVTGATTLSIDNGVGTVTGSSSVVNPTATTTYTLTASNAAGAVSATATVGVSSSTGFVYSDPTPSQQLGKKLVLVNNPSLSTADLAVIDVKVGAAPLTLFGVAMNLPLDGAKATFDPSTGIVLPAVKPIDPGSGAGRTAAGKAVTAGPLANMLTLGFARQKVQPGDGDVTVQPGTTIFSFAIKRQPGASGVVFDGSTFASNSSVKLGALDKTGATVAATTDFAVGKLATVQ